MFNEVEKPVNFSALEGRRVGIPMGILQVELDISGWCTFKFAKLLEEVCSFK